MRLQIPLLNQTVCAFNEHSSKFNKAEMCSNFSIKETYLQSFYCTLPPVDCSIKPDEPLNGVQRCTHIIYKCATVVMGAACCIALPDVSQVIAIYLLKGYFSIKSSGIAMHNREKIPENFPQKWRKFLVCFVSSNSTPLPIGGILMQNMFVDFSMNICEYSNVNKSNYANSNLYVVS